MLRTSKAAAIALLGVLCLVAAVWLARPDGIWHLVGDWMGYPPNVPVVDLRRPAEDHAVRSYRIACAGRAAPGMRSLTLSNDGTRVAQHFWLWTSAQPNFHNLDTLATSIASDAGTDEEKLLAAFDLFGRYMAHNQPPRDVNNVVPSVGFAAYGYGLCLDVQMSAGALLEKLGIQSQAMHSSRNGRSPHSTNLAHIGQRNVFVDFDTGRLFRGPAGQLLTFEQALSEEHRGRVSKRDASYLSEYFGTGLDTRITRKSAGDSYLRTEVHRRDPETGKEFLELANPVSHEMAFCLRPGEKIVIPYAEGRMCVGRGASRSGDN